MTDSYFAIRVKATKNLLSRSESLSFYESDGVTGAPHLFGDYEEAVKIATSDSMEWHDYRPEELEVIPVLLSHASIDDFTHVGVRDPVKAVRRGEVDWVLIAGIHAACQCMEEDHGWDLSTGEYAALLKSFYPTVRAWLAKWHGSKLPKEKYVEFRADLNAAFETAYKQTWGDDHECDATKPEELADFAKCLFDSFFEFKISPVHVHKAFEVVCSRDEKQPEYITCRQCNADVEAKHYDHCWCGWEGCEFHYEEHLKRCKPMPGPED